jgi:hypothetical protein
MLPAGTAGTARLQGWATLENQSGSDWKNVALTLQYGNPVTFRQSLYRSYFVQRPEVPVEILGHVLPDIDTRSRAMPFAMSPAPAPPPAAKSRAAMMAPVAGAPAQDEPAPIEPPAADETPEETIFSLSQPVDLAAGHSANLPIIDRQVPAARIGLVPYQQSHPLAAIRVKNDDTNSLPAGVLTLYDASTGSVSFAGDARLGGLPPGETRLLSFAQDLRTTIETSQSPRPDTMTAYSVADGVLTYTMLTRQVIKITATAPAQQPRDLLLEIPKSDTDQTLTTDGGKAPVTEQTATAFRIPLSLAAGESRTITAWLDQPVEQTVALVDGDDSILQTIVSEEKLNPTGRTALRRILTLRQDQARKSTELDRQNKQLENVLADEDRIRKNLAAVTPTDTIRARLTKALDADETTIDTLRKSIETATTDLAKAHRDLADAVTTLRI